MNYQLSQESLDFGNSFQPAATDHEKIIMALHHEVESLKAQLAREKHNHRWSSTKSAHIAAILIEKYMEDNPEIPDWQRDMIGLVTYSLLADVPAWKRNKMAEKINSREYDHDEPVFDDTEEIARCNEADDWVSEQYARSF